MAGEGDILHGGARRLRLEWRRPGAVRPDQLSWYRIAPSERCTTHRHTGKSETWLIVAGEGRVTIGDDVFDASIGDAFVTEAGVPHAIDNTGAEWLVFVNIASFTGGSVTTTELDGP